MSILSEISLPHLEYVVPILPLITFCHTCIVLCESTVYHAVLSLLICRVSDSRQPFSSALSLSLHSVATARRLRVAWNSRVLYTRTTYLCSVLLSVDNGTADDLRDVSGHVTYRPTPSLDRCYVNVSRPNC